MVAALPGEPGGQPGPEEPQAKPHAHPSAWATAVPRPQLTDSRATWGAPRIRQTLRPRGTRPPAMPEDAPPQKQGSRPHPSCSASLGTSAPTPTAAPGMLVGPCPQPSPCVHSKIGPLGHPHRRSVGRDTPAPQVWWGRNAGTSRERHAREPNPGPQHLPGKLTSWRMSSSLGMMESSSTSSLRGEGTEGSGWPGSVPACPQGDQSHPHEGMNVPIPV